MTKRILAAGVFAAAALAGAALAEDAASAFYGNTVKVTYNTDEPFVVSWFLNEDGSYTNSEGESGTYTYDAGTVCVIPAAADAERRCATGDDAVRAPGDSWTLTADDDGMTMTAELIEGRAS